MKRVFFLILFFIVTSKMSANAFAAEYKCHAFCGTPAIFAEMNILNTGQVVHKFSSGKSLEESFENLQTTCKKQNSHGVPLRFLHAPTSAQNLVKIVLVPALSGDVCVPSY